METFQLPLSEIEERFTKSELMIVGWRSQETAYQMDLQMKKGSSAVGPPQEARAMYNDPTLPTNLPAKFFNKDGEVDLRQVTGPEALKFLHLQGIDIFAPTNVHNEKVE